MKKKIEKKKNYKKSQKNRVKKGYKIKNRNPIEIILEPLN